jgi:hypothetical protein
MKKLFILVLVAMIIAGVVSAAETSQLATVANLSRTNDTMRAYVNNAIAGVSAGSTDVTWNTSYFQRAGGLPIIGTFNLSNTSINWLVTGINGDSAANKSYVDTMSHDHGWNASYSTIANMSSNNATLYLITVSNISATNNSMKAYVDNAIAGVGGGGSGDTSKFLFTNGTRIMQGNLDMGNYTIINATEFRPFNRTRAVVIESDFYDASTDAIPGLLGVVISSGTVNANLTTAAHPGVINLRDSTTAAGGYRFGCSGSQLIGGKEVFDVVFQANSGITHRQRNISARMGWSDSTAGATMPTDGIWLNLTNKTTSWLIEGSTANNGARTVTGTSYGIANYTWYRGVIQVNDAATSVSYKLYSDDGALVWSDTTTSNIPTATNRDTSPCIIVAESTTTAAADILLLDYVKWDTNRTLARG